MNTKESIRDIAARAAVHDGLPDTILMRAVRWIVVLLALGRVAYSLPYFLAAWVGDWLLPPYSEVGPEVLGALRDVSGWLLVVWTGYMAGFLTTGLLLVLQWPRGLKWAFPAAAAAVFLDQGYWIWILAEPFYTQIDGPALLIEDVILNLASFAVLLGVGALRFWPRPAS